MYICDLSEAMDGLPCREGCYCPAPICLLYVNGLNKLVPIAIQLKKTPGKDNPIFLPSDNWFDWVLAKIYYRSADAQVSTHAFYPFYEHVINIIVAFYATMCSIRFYDYPMCFSKSMSVPLIKQSL